MPFRFSAFLFYCCRYPLWFIYEKISSFKTPTKNLLWIKWWKISRGIFVLTMRDSGVVVSVLLCIMMYHFSEVFFLFFKISIGSSQQWKGKKNLLAIASKTLKALQCLLFIVQYFMCFLTTSYHNRNIYLLEEDQCTIFLQPRNLKCL